MAQTAAYQLARTNIRVNSICPGLIETGMTSNVFQMARQRGTASKIGQLNPLGRYGVAEGIISFTYTNAAFWYNKTNIVLPQRLPRLLCF